MEPKGGLGDGDRWQLARARCLQGAGGFSDMGTIPDLRALALDLFPLLGGEETLSIEHNLPSLLPEPAVRRVDVPIML